MRRNFCRFVVRCVLTNARPSAAQLSDLIRKTQTDLSREDRQRVMCMITIDAHARDIVDKLIREGVKCVLRAHFDAPRHGLTGCMRRDMKAFQWNSQLKQRFRDNKAIITIAAAIFNYGFEYLGNGPRLVITPLTDRIYVTATQVRYSVLWRNTSGTYACNGAGAELVHGMCASWTRWYWQDGNNKGDCSCSFVVGCEFCLTGVWRRILRMRLRRRATCSIARPRYVIA